MGPYVKAKRVAGAVDTATAGQLGISHDATASRGHTQRHSALTAMLRSTDDVVCLCKGGTPPLRLAGPGGPTNWRQVTMSCCDKAKRLTGAHGHAAGQRATNTMRQRVVTRWLWHGAAAPCQLAGRPGTSIPRKQWCRLPCRWRAAPGAG